MNVTLPEQPPSETVATSSRPIWPLWDGSEKPCRHRRPVRCITCLTMEAVMLKYSDVASKCHQREVVRSPPFRMCI